MKCGTPRLVEQRLQVDLIDQHTRTGLGRHLTHLPQRAVVGQNAAGVMQIAEDDQPCVRSDPAFQLAESDPKVLLSAALEARYSRT